MLKRSSSRNHFVPAGQEATGLGSRLVACGACAKGIQADGTFSGNYYAYEGRKIHEECFETFMARVADPCELCHGPLAEIPGKYTGHFIILEDERKVHDECWADFQCIENVAMKAGKVLLCAVCSEPCKTYDTATLSGKYLTYENGDAVHAECKETYIAKTANKCSQCNMAIAKVDGFSGRFYDVEGGAKVHFECISSFRAAQAGSCAVCGQPCYKHDRFSGEYTIFGEEKVHAECEEEFQEARAEVCARCGKGIRPCLAFSGEYYTLDDGRLVHAECHN